jgi:hypothetical protein
MRPTPAVAGGMTWKAWCDSNLVSECFLTPKG